MTDFDLVELREEVLRDRWALNPGLKDATVALIDKFRHYDRVIAEAGEMIRDLEAENARLKAGLKMIPEEGKVRRKKTRNLANDRRKWKVRALTWKGERDTLKARVAELEDERDQREAAEEWKANMERP